MADAYSIPEEGGRGEVEGRPLLKGFVEKNSLLKERLA